MAVSDRVGPKKTWMFEPELPQVETTQFVYLLFVCRLQTHRKKLGDMTCLIQKVYVGRKLLIDDLAILYIQVEN